MRFLPDIHCLLRTSFLAIVTAGLLAGCVRPTPQPPPATELTEPARDYSFGYWPNGWRKTVTDTSPDRLAIETGYYGFLLDVDQLPDIRFGRLAGDVDYPQALAAGTKRLARLPRGRLTIELETGGTVYRAVTCRAGTDTDIRRLQSNRLWESGRYVQHFDVQDLEFRDAAGNRLGCYGDLYLVAWPGSLTFKTELTPDYLYLEGPSPGVSGNGRCIIDEPIDIPHAPELDSETFTAESWFRVPAKLGQKDGWLLCKNDNEWEEGNYGFRMTWGGKRAVAVMNIGGGRDNVYQVEQLGELAKGEWHHLAMTYDGQVLRLYHNGELQGETEIGKQRVPGSGRLRIGQRADGVTGPAVAPIVRGLYDEIRIWNRALSGEEIAAHAEQAGEVPSRDGLVQEHNFDAGAPVEPPTWTDATLRLALRTGDHTWQEEKQVTGAWQAGQVQRLVLHCNLAGTPGADDTIGIRVRTPAGQEFPVAWAEDTNCHKVLVQNLERTWERITDRPDQGAGNNYDEFLVEVENRGDQPRRIPFQLHLLNPAGITGLVPLLCEEDGTPTGIPVQLSKNWHQGSYLHAFTMLPAEPGLTRYRLRIVYGFYGTLPTASHSQLSLVGYGGNGRWDQLAIGSWGETFCLDMDMSPTDVTITDVRGLYLRAGKDGEKWGWSDGGWGGDWLRITNSRGEKLAFSEMKTAYLAHGPCLSDVRYRGAYGPRREARLAATVRTLRTDDHARTFHTLRYAFTQPVSTADAWLFKVGGGWCTTPKIAYGNRAGLIAEHEVPESLAGIDEFRPPVTLTGAGPWWVAYPGALIDDPKRPWGNGSRALVIRGYRASFGGTVVDQPTIAFPVNHTRGQRDVNLLLVPPPGVERFQPGDTVELDLEWIVVPREADDYFGPNEAFRRHLDEHPRSWKTVHREAVGNDLAVDVTGGTVTHRYPLIIQATAPEITVEISGGIGQVPIRFDGLATAAGYVLYEENDGQLTALDQSVHGNDFWQTDLDPRTDTYRLGFNLPLDGKPTSRWVLKRNP